MTLGQVIRRERTKKGWSQGKLAEQAGLSLTYVSNVEIGKVNPSVKSLYKLSGAIGIFAGTMMLEVERGEQSECCKCCGHIYGCYCVEYPHDHADCPGDWKQAVKDTILAAIYDRKTHEIHSQVWRELERLVDDCPPRTSSLIVDERDGLAKNAGKS